MTPRVQCHVCSPFFLSLVLKVMDGLHSTPSRNSINTALNWTELCPRLHSAKDTFSNFSVYHPPWFLDYVHLLPDPEFIGIALITYHSVSLVYSLQISSFQLYPDPRSPVSLPSLFSSFSIHLFQQAIVSHGCPITFLRVEAQEMFDGINE